MDEVQNQVTGEQMPGGPSLGRLLLLIASALVVYILSVGPVCKLSDKGLIGDRFLQTVYAPLSSFAKISPVIGSFFTWYCKTVWKTRC
jgi:hypothetical protein